MNTLYFRYLPNVHLLYIVKQQVYVPSCLLASFKTPFTYSFRCTYSLAEIHKVIMPDSLFFTKNSQCISDDHDLSWHLSWIIISIFLEWQFYCEDSIVNFLVIRQRTVSDSFSCQLIIKRDVSETAWLNQRSTQPLSSNFPALPLPSLPIPMYSWTVVIF